MNCDDCKTNFVDYLYGELGVEEEARLKEHLSLCETCRGEYEALSKTSVLLRAWPDEDPGSSLVFVRERSGVLDTLRHLIWPVHATLGRRLLAGVATAAVALLLIAAMLNFELSRSSDRLQVHVSLLPRPTATPELDSSLVRQLREQNLQLINQVLLANRTQQRQEMARTLAQFAQEVHRQRENDLVLVGRGMEHMQQLTDTRLQRTNEVLNSLIRTATYQPQQ